LSARCTLHSCYNSSPQSSSLHGSCFSKWWVNCFGVQYTSWQTCLNILYLECVLLCINMWERCLDTSWMMQRLSICVIQLYETVVCCLSATCYRCFL
jgi:hypothetical protein